MKNDLIERGKITAIEDIKGLAEIYNGIDAEIARLENEKDNCKLLIMGFDFGIRPQGPINEMADTIDKLRRLKRDLAVKIGYRKSYGDTYGNDKLCSDLEKEMQIRWVTKEGCNGLVNIYAAKDEIGLIITAKDNVILSAKEN